MENLDIFAYELAEEKAREKCAEIIDGIACGFKPSDKEDFDLAVLELHKAIAKLMYLKSKVKELKVFDTQKEKATLALGLKEGR